MKPPILAILFLAAVAAPAQAAGTFDASGAWITKPDPGTLTGDVPTEAEPIDNQICEAFGPGFTAVAGGTMMAIALYNDLARLLGQMH